MLHARHHISSPWYIFASFFPFTSVLICWVFFYSLNHYTPGKILTISETVISWPENRIFAGTMHIEALLLLLLYLVRNRMIALWASRRSSLPSSFRYCYLICRCCAALSPIGLSLVSIVTLTDQATLHHIGGFLFFYGSIIYFLTSDSCLRSVGFCPSIFSRFLSWITLVLALLSPALIAFSDIGLSFAVALSNSGSLFQYLAALAMFVKVLHFYYDLPPHRITILAREE